MKVLPFGEGFLPFGESLVKVFGGGEVWETICGVDFVRLSLKPGESIVRLRIIRRKLAAFRWYYAATKLNFYLLPPLFSSIIFGQLIFKLYICNKDKDFRQDVGVEFQQVGLISFSFLSLHFCINLLFYPLRNPSY